MAAGKVKDWIDPKTKRLHPDKAELLSSWCKKGLNEAEIAKEMGISRSTLNEWKKKYPDISDTMKRTRAYAHACVENSLFRRATGYTVPLIKQFKVKKPIFDKAGEKIIGWEEQLQEGREEMHVPADTKAIIFYLKNRLPEDWKEKIAEVSEEDENNAGLVFMQSLENVLKKKAAVEKMRKEAEKASDDTGGDLQQHTTGSTAGSTKEKKACGMVSAV